jgi:hypothetical protein
MTDHIIPCIKNKCILYPACKSKQTINCSLLLEYFFSLSMEMIGYSHKWIIVEKDFPNLEVINTTNGELGLKKQ